MKYLVDATYVIDFFRGRPHAQTLYQRLIQDGFGVSIITHLELWEGVDRQP